MTHQQICRRPAVCFALLSLVLCAFTASVGAQNAGENTFAGLFDLSGHHVDQICINRPANRVYVADITAQQILLLDATTGATVAVIDASFPTGPMAMHVRRAVAVSERMNRFYVPRRRADTSTPNMVDVFDGSTGARLNSIPVTGVDNLDTLVAVDDVRRRIYVVGVTRSQSGGTKNLPPVTSYLSYLATIDQQSEQQTAVVMASATGGIDELRDIAADQITGRVYVLDSLTLTIFDGNTGHYVQSVHASPNYDFAQLALDQAAGLVFILRRDGYSTQAPYISIVDAHTNSIVSTINFDLSTDSRLSDAFVDEATRTLYVLGAGTSSSPPRMLRFDGNNGFAPIDAIDVDAGVANITFDPTRRRIMVGENVPESIKLLQNSIPPQPDRLGNISTRGNIGTGGNVLIGGFIVSGNDPKKVLVRAIGPSLSQAGIANALPDTTLELHDDSGHVFHNDDWQKTDLADFDSSQSAAIAATGIAPTDARESAMVLQLNPGTYTAVVADKSGSTGIGLVEVYDLDAGSEPQLGNVATRGVVGAGDDAMIGGVIVVGNAPSRILFRALGPSLTRSGILNPLSDPTLELRDVNGGLIAGNDDWRAYENEVNAIGLAPTDDRESAIPVTLYPANYTAVVRGKNGASGVALIEAYRLQ